MEVDLIKAIGMYIFCGSQTIGHLLEGWEIDTILEMTDNMLNQNAYHFHKNYPEINIKLPKDYENNEEYLESLTNKYDLLYANPPCSGLSTINKNASVECSINQYIYKVANMVSKIQPKTFLIENAPTLTSRGLPILKDISKTLNDYYLLIINDIAGNHNVPMYRRRTFVVGFNKKYFSGIPKISTEHVEASIYDILANIDYTYNKEFAKGTDEYIFSYYKNIKPGQILYTTLAQNNITGLPAKHQTQVDHIKSNLNSGNRVWDKSPYRPKNKNIQSLASVVRIMHPTEDRDFYVREYAAMMGYPDDFIFYQDACRTPVIQCIAQGVPVNFIRYISRQIKNSFDSKDFIEGEIVYINQTNPENIKMAIYKNRKDFINTPAIYL